MINSRSERRLSVPFPVVNDPTVYVSARLAVEADDDEGFVTVRCRNQPGFIPEGLFCTVMRLMRKPEKIREEQGKIERIWHDEYRFIRSRVTITAKRCRDGVSMRVLINLLDTPYAGIIERRLSPATCTEISGLLKMAGAVLVQYDVEPVDELADDARTWLASFGEYCDGRAEVIAVRADAAAETAADSDGPPVSTTADVAE